MLFPIAIGQSGRCERTAGVLSLRDPREPIAGVPGRAAGRVSGGFREGGRDAVSVPPGCVARDAE